MISVDIINNVDSGEELSMVNQSLAQLVNEYDCKC